MEADRTGPFSEIGQFGPKQLFRKQVRDPVSPFNGDDAVSRKNLLETEFLCLFLIPETKQVNVIERESSAIFMDQGKRGRGDAIGPFYTQAGGQPLNIMGFSSSQLSYEGNGIAGSKKRPYSLPQVNGLLCTLSEKDRLLFQNQLNSTHPASGRVGSEGNATQGSLGLVLKIIRVEIFQPFLELIVIFF